MLSLRQDIVDQENGNKELLGCILDTPFSLLLLSNPKDIYYVNHKLPYSIGIEIECHKSAVYNVKSFTQIPTIMEVSNDDGEQRYRIPNGINGFICLAMICNQLKINSMLNPGSGIHYHVDCTDLIEVKSSYMLDNNSDWILPELDKWQFRGTQKRGIGSDGSWIRTNGLGTFEFRIGDMTFDYKEIVTRILSATSIVKRLKESTGYHPIPIFREFQKDKFVKYLKDSKTSIYKSQIPKVVHEKPKVDNGNDIIKTRTIKLE
jgi:hypothetical protein